MFRKLIAALILISIVFLLGYVNKPAFSAGITYSRLARLSVESYFNKTKLNYNSLNLINPYNGKILGVFVTLLDKNKKSRGCWGTLYPQSNLKESIAMAAIDAVRKDYRFKPVKQVELIDLKFQVSVVSKIIPVSSTREINPFRDGLMVQSGSKNGIILPAEAVDSHYQMIQAKLKAGIQPGEKYHLFKLVTKTYKE